MSRILPILLLLAVACGPAETPPGRPAADHVVHRGVVFPGFAPDRPLLGSGWAAPAVFEGRWGAWTTARFATAAVVSAGSSARFELRARSRVDTPVTVMVDDAILGTVTVTPEWTRLVLPGHAAPSTPGIHRVSLEIGEGAEVFVSRLTVSPDPRPDPDPWDRPDAGGPASAVVLPLVHAGGADLWVEWSSPGRGTAKLRFLDPVEGAILLQEEVSAPGGVTRWSLPESAPPGAVVVTSAESMGVQQWGLDRPLAGVDVVLLVVDTLRSDHLACYGHPEARTPHLDRLAAEGILFENAYSHIPITGPSHAALLTSKPPSELGFLNNHHQKLAPRTFLFPEILREHGYASAAAVAIDPIRGSFGFRRGWDAYLDQMGYSWILPAELVLSRIRAPMLESTSPSLTWVHLAEPHEPYDAHGLVERSLQVRRNGDVIRGIPTSTYRPTLVTLPGSTAELTLTSEDLFVLRMLKGMDGTTLDPPSAPRGRRTEYTFTATSPGDSLRVLISAHDPPGGLEYARARYVREVEAVDASLGEVMDDLRSRGRWDDTLVIFTSDHGEGLGCHGHMGHVQNLYECQVRVPLIVKPPRGVGDPPGTRRTDLAALVDVMPTVLDAVGLPPFAGMRGRSLVDPAQRRGPDDLILLETHRPQAQRTKYALRGGDWKFIWTPEEERQELYNLADDPGEKDNLADRDPERTATWLRRLETTLAAARSAGPDASDLEVDAEALEILRSLGYVQ